MFIELFVCVSISLAAQPRDSKSGGMGADEIKGVQEKWWQSMGTLEFVCTEAAIKSDGTIASEGNRMVYDYAQSEGGKRDIHIKSILGTREVTNVEDRTDDGRKSYTILPFVDHPNDASKLVIQSQLDTQDDYHGTMFSVMWLMMPGGQPLHRRFQGGGEVVRELDAQNQIYGISFHHNGNEVVCELDGNHDWLPKRVYFRSIPDVYWSVSSFVKRGGHWFPERGESGAIGPKGKKVRSGFQVDGLKINAPISMGRFSMPKIKDGVIVATLDGKRHQDVFSRDSRMTRADRWAVRRRYEESVLGVGEQPKSDGNAIKYPRDRVEFPWGYLAGACGLAFFSVAIGLQVRRARR